jgi:hypothetical protein
MRAIVFAQVLLVASIAGCSSPPELAANRPIAATDACAASWRETLDWGIALQSEPSTSMGAALSPLVTADMPPDLDVQQAADLWLTGNEVHEGPREALDGPALSAALEEWVQVQNKLARPGDPPSTVCLAVEPDVKWGLVAETVERIRSAGYGQVGWAFTRPHPVRKPAWWWRDLQTDQAMQRSYERSHSWDWRASLSDQTEVLDQVLSSCPELARLPRTSTMELLAALRASEAPCRCRVDQRGLRSVLWAAHPADESTARVVAFVAEDDPRATVIEASADTPWAEVAPRIAALPSRAPVQLRVTQP